ncbi:hypothetical protein RFI_32335, partial [Reticulomyxa filosa]
GESKKREGVGSSSSPGERPEPQKRRKTVGDFHRHAQAHHRLPFDLPVPANEDRRRHADRDSPVPVGQTSRDHNAKHNNNGNGNSGETQRNNKSGPSLLYETNRKEIFCLKKKYDCFISNFLCIYIPSFNSYKIQQKGIIKVLEVRISQMKNLLNLQIHIYFDFSFKMENRVPFSG